MLFISYNFSVLTYHRYSKFFLEYYKWQLILQTQYHRCWWVGDASSRVSAAMISAKFLLNIPGSVAGGLTQWGRVTHICVNKLTAIGSDNGLSPGRRQAIVWTNAVILLIGTLGTTFSEILVGIRLFSLKKMHLKMSSGKWWPFCLGLNVLTQ